jgi:CheY-like chemotaxis protein
LVIDDDARVRETLREVVAHLGYDVEVAQDGSAALTRFHDRPADVVITDLRMPGLDGLQVAAELRFLHPRLPIILITGFAGETSIHEAQRMGLSIVQKPIGVAALKAASAAVLSAE